MKRTALIVFMVLAVVLAVSGVGLVFPVEEQKRNLLLVGATGDRPLPELFATEDVDVTYVWYGDDFPDTLEELDQYDVIIFVNVDSTIFTVQEMVNVRRFVQELGGTFVMAGGYGSFGGVDGLYGYNVVGYDGTPIEDILPVEVSSSVDVCWKEFTPRILEQHFLTDGIFKHHPLMYGLNIVEAKEGSTVLADDGECNPFLVYWQCGKGKVLAFTSDIGPGWGKDYIHWQHVEEFWHRVTIWATTKD